MSLSKHCLIYSSAITSPFSFFKTSSVQLLTDLIIKMQGPFCTQFKRTLSILNTSLSTYLHSLISTLTLVESKSRQPSHIYLRYCMNSYSKWTKTLCITTESSTLFGMVSLTSEDYWTAWSIWQSHCLFYSTVCLEICSIAFSQVSYSSLKWSSLKAETKIHFNWLVNVSQLTTVSLSGHALIETRRRNSWWRRLRREHCNTWTLSPSSKAKWYWR